MTSKKKEKGPFKKWYEKNKDEFNRRRREKYHSDPETRAKALANARKQRQKTGPTEKEPLMREWNGEKVMVYTVTEVAESINRSAATIRSWEREGIIPKPVFKEPVRLYTKNQINLLRWLVGEVSKAKSKMEKGRVYRACTSTLITKWGD